MSDISRMLLDSEPVKHYTELRTEYTLFDEKIVSLIYSRLFNEPGLFSNIRLGGECADVGDGSELSVDNSVDIDDIRFGSNLERYVMCNYTTVYERLRFRFAKALGHDIRYIPYASEVLDDACSCASNSTMGYLAFKSEHPDLILAFLQERYDDADFDVEDFADKVNRAFPSVKHFLDALLSYDPEGEMYDLTGWVYHSEKLGAILSREPVTEDEKELKRAVDGLTFIKKNVVDGVFFGYEEIGYTSDESCREEFFPTNTLTSHDVANMAVIERLLPKILKEEPEDEHSC